MPESHELMPNIKMQKTGAGRAYQGDPNLPASDLERYTP